MQEVIYDVLAQLNIPQLLAIGWMVWLGYSRLDKKIDKLDEKLTDVDRRLCRLEGAFSKQECCMLKDHKHAASE